MTNLIPQPPTMDYSGLCIAMSRASRHDKDKLISGYCNIYFERCLLLAGTRRDACWVQLMDEDIPEGTKCILALGEAAARKFCEDNIHSLNELRGNYYEYNGIPVVSTYTPQDVYDRWNMEGEGDDPIGESEHVKEHSVAKRSNWKFWFREDIKKAGRLLRDKPKGWISIDHSSRVDTILSQLVREPIPQRLFIDIETTSNYNITTLTIGWENNNILNIPFLDHTKKQFFSSRIYILLWKFLHRCFTGSTLVIAHNASFDLFILSWRLKLPVPENTYDTMIAHHRLHPEVEKSLGHCISLYLNEPFHKDEGVFNPQSLNQWHQLNSYNKKDVDTLMELYDAQQLRLAKDDSTFKRINNSCSFLNPFIRQSLRGIHLDCKQLDKEVVMLKDLCQQLLRVAERLVGYDINLNSPQQLSEYLYTFREYTKPKSKTATSTDKHSLLLVLQQSNDPLLKLLFRYRELSKELTALNFCRWGRNGDKFTTAVNICGTNTLRLSTSTLLPFKRQYEFEGHKRTMTLGWGDNVQNFKKRLRRFFVAPKGYKLCQADLAGAESMLVAYLCREGKFKELARLGIKHHVYVAMHLFPDVWAKKLGLSYKAFKGLYLDCPLGELKDLPNWKKLVDLIKSSDDDTGGKRYYYIAKKTVHASNYDMGWVTFRKTLLAETNGVINLTAREAKRLLDTFHALFPEIREWHKKTIAIASARYWRLKNLLGDDREFIGNINRGPLDPEPDVKRKMYAFVPQSTVGTITNEGAVRFQREVDGERLGYRLLNTVHDSILVMSREEEVLDAARLLNKCLCRELTYGGEKFRMRTEILIGDNWKEMEEVEV